MKGEKHHEPSIWEDLLFLVIKIGLIVFLGILLFGFVFGIHRCSDDSMSPALKNGDLVFYYRLQREYQPGDAIVLKKDQETQIRRIIAKAGDQVDITEDGLKINGYLQQEDNIYTETLPYVEGMIFPITVEEGEYFVLGDDRINVKDSRIYGTVKEEEIKGIVMTLLRRRGF